MDKDEFRETIDRCGDQVLDAGKSLGLSDVELAALRSWTDHGRYFAEAIVTARQTAPAQA